MHLVTFELREDRVGRSTDVRLRTGLGDAQVGSLSERALGFESLDLARPGRHRLGALIPPGPRTGDVVDLNRAMAVRLAGEDSGAPEVEADSLLPSDMLAFLRSGQEGLHEAQRTLRWVRDVLGRFDGPDLVRAGVVYPRRNVRLCAPILRPGKLIGVGRNYASHARERGAEPPSEPVLFIKASSAVIGSEDDIALPAASHQVDYEGELAAVIGREARAVDVADALGYVAGYTIANDVTARDFQNVRGQHYIGKSCDTFAPTGPALVTRDEIESPQKLGLRTYVSGELRQSANTGEMIFSVAELVAFASRLMTLEPGDILLTGTPAGVGAAAEPPRFLREGDVVDVDIEGVGQLRSYVTRESAQPRGVDGESA